jgi:hypothetical protein
MVRFGTVFQDEQDSRLEIIRDLAATLKHLKVRGLFRSLFGTNSAVSSFNNWSNSGRRREIRDTQSFRARIRRQQQDHRDRNGCIACQRAQDCWRDSRANPYRGQFHRLTAEIRPASSVAPRHLTLMGARHFFLFSKTWLTMEPMLAGVQNRPGEKPRKSQKDCGCQ